MVLCSEDPSYQAQENVTISRHTLSDENQGGYTGSLALYHFSDLCAMLPSLEANGPTSGVSRSMRQASKR